MARPEGGGGCGTGERGTDPGGAGGDPSVLDANYPPQLTVGRRPLGGGGGRGIGGGGFWEGRGGGGGSGRVGWGGGGLLASRHRSF